MATIIWVIIIVVVFITFLLIRKMIKKSRYEDEEDIFDKSSRSSFGDCCKKIGRMFGGGA